jgi:hypothetical protein
MTALETAGKNLDFIFKVALYPVYNSSYIRQIHQEQTFQLHGGAADAM